MRLIDADAVKMARVPYDDELSEYEKGWNDAMIAVAGNAETIDAVEVVRCKDCEQSYIRYDGGLGCELLCESINWVDKEDYCSFGERKVDDGKQIS